jgi:adenine-specific DNA-methyltransferase
MRAAPTQAEAVLWAALRRRHLGGWKFRRQHIIAGYIVDFYCAELSLAVELDGPLHDKHRDNDLERDEHLATLGVAVVRLRNADVLERLDAVLDQLTTRCEGIAQRRTSVAPFPPPRGGKGRG